MNSAMSSSRNTDYRQCPSAVPSTPVFSTGIGRGAPLPSGLRTPAPCQCAGIGGWRWPAKGGMAGRRSILYGLYHGASQMQSPFSCSRARLAWSSGILIGWQHSCADSPEKMIGAPNQSCLLRNGTVTW